MYIEERAWMGARSANEKVEELMEFRMKDLTVGAAQVRVS